MSGGETAIRKLIEAAETFQDEPPRPLQRELPPAQPFPAQALGTVLNNAAISIQDRTQAPLAICAQSVLATATLAVQGHADVLLPTGQQRPISGYFLTVAASGERKSSCDGEALAPVWKREAALREAYQTSQANYQNDQEAWEVCRKKALKGKDREAVRNALEAVGPEPLPPLSPVLTAPEPTYEGLCKLLAVGQPSVGVFSAEAGQFVGGHGMTAETKLRTAAGFSCLWDGDIIKRVRAGDGVTVLPGRRVAMHLMAQPDVAAIMLCDRVMQDQGFLSRVLVTAPESAMGRRIYREASHETEIASAQYGSRLLELLEMPLPTADASQNELRPRKIPLSRKARELWIQYAKSVEAALGSGQAYETIRGLANKLPEHAARLAAVLTLVNNSAASEVTGEEMAAGIELANHYADEALRLHMAKVTDPALVEAQTTLAWCSNQPRGLVALVDLYQRGPNSIRDAKKARHAVRILEDHGWLIPIGNGAEVNGTFRREVWRVWQDQA